VADRDFLADKQRLNIRSRPNYLWDVATGRCFRGCWRATMPENTAQAGGRRSRVYVARRTQRPEGELGRRCLSGSGWAGLAECVPVGGDESVELHGALPARGAAGSVDQGLCYAGWIRGRRAWPSDVSFEVAFDGRSRRRCAMGDDVFEPTAAIAP